jgi:hypothetical protein
LSATIVDLRTKPSSKRCTHTRILPEKIQSGFPTVSGPIAYAVNGKQYIVDTGGGVMYALALD